MVEGVVVVVVVVLWVVGGVADEYSKKTGCDVTFWVSSVEETPTRGTTLSVVVSFATDVVFINGSGVNASNSSRGTLLNPLGKEVLLLMTSWVLLIISSALTANGRGLTEVIELSDVVEVD